MDTYYDHKVLIVDDHLIVRTGLGLVLKNAMEHIQISNAENFTETIAILKENPFDLIILDINIPGGKNIGMIDEIKLIQPTVKILMFSAFEECHYACRYILSGANGYLNKLSGEPLIIEAVQTILKGGKYIPFEIVNQIVEASQKKRSTNPLEILSKREFEIGSLLIIGNGNLEISNKLNIQMSTISTYKKRVFNKLKVNNTVDLASIFKIYVA